ncbi:A disintegrin and metalloproteinase with thrombospondin motifs adt-2 [Prorops nasuta]|uniref:A disintegrin and metalloproteinase with thrombospondin motifs adt-2 n=1 Tax=Prorops nasuta TaxID=863751 RepID=UPI0034CD3D54
MFNVKMLIVFCKFISANCMTVGLTGSMLIIIICVLLASLSSVHGYREEDDVDVILLPVWNSTELPEIKLKFVAFGQIVELILERNDKITSSSFEVWRHNEDGSQEQLEYLKNPESCHYLHRNTLSTAAISLCYQSGVHGFVFLNNVTLEITPLRNVKYSGRDKKSQIYSDLPHVIKRAVNFPNFLDDYETIEKRNFRFDRGREKKSIYNDFIHQSMRKRELNERLTLELAIFFDEAAYELYSPFMNRKDEEIRDMLLAYVNGVQALYHHPSLGARIDISLVRLDIMHKQPGDLPHFNGERGSLLDSFCNYAKIHNAPKDEEPGHWDMALYVSGLDFYAWENGRKNPSTMGLAIVSGVCVTEYSCVIAELGTTNVYGKPYPSAGFNSVYIAAHEIGHNLGMLHDSTGNACPRDGYIMSPSRGVSGETIWSSCSKEVAMDLGRTKPCLLDGTLLDYEVDDSLDHTQFLELPGRKWHAKRQCEFLLRDRDATFVSLTGACESLQCKSPHRTGFYYSGPALDGTFCDTGKECRAGVCLPALFFPTDMPDISGWSSWKEEPCNSGCLQKSKGAFSRHRICKGSNCKGVHYDVQLCKDEILCNKRKMKKKRRQTAEEFATERCRVFSEKLDELDEEGNGLQAPHESERPWMACAIFCRRKDIASYYTPRLELNDLGLDPYFPDGTWCHNEDDQDYFCRQHHCLPESFRFGKGLFEHFDLDDLDFGPQNAQPSGGLRLPDQLIKYLSLGMDGRPLLTTLSTDVLPPDDQNDWLDNDYVEIPHDLD